MTYVITQNCCNDTSCVEVCPVDCIHPGPDNPDFGSAEMLYIDPAECIDCGACQDACPVEAVFPDYEVPEHLESYAALNADFFTWIGSAPDPVALPPEGPKIESEEPLRVAVVGSGPSGWFVVDELVRSRRIKSEITVLDRLATPFGLVRYGVAPDHLETKAITDTFASRAGHRSTAVRLNVHVGRDVTHEELLQHHHAVVYATGAAQGRTLGIPGEDLPGSTTSAELVGWYNGHPDQADREVDLSHRRAVVIGNGNVALDIARVLLSTPERRLASDMATHAIEALEHSQVDEVVVVARRGAEHAAFTTPELRALVDDPDIDVVVDAADVDGLAERVADLAGGERNAATFATHQKAELLTEVAAAGESGGAKRLVLRFGVTPVEILGDGRVEGLRVTATGGDGGTEDIEAGLVVRATGYRTVAVADVPFDESAGRFGHVAGRVVDPETGDVVAATYTSGWAKRGPSGVIGTNRMCAAETVRSLLDDRHAGLLAHPAGGLEQLDALLAERGVDVVDVAAWKVLDKHEVSTGKESGRPRLKVVRHAQQVEVALGGAS